MTTESFQERLEKIIKKTFEEGQLCSDHDWDVPLKETKQSILELLKETMPAEDPNSDLETSRGWNMYRTELLKRWGIS